jgi:hypothetical protein
LRGDENLKHLVFAAAILIVVCGGVALSWGTSTSDSKGPEQTMFLSETGQLSEISGIAGPPFTHKPGLFDERDDVALVFVGCVALMVLAGVIELRRRRRREVLTALRRQLPPS